MKNRGPFEPRFSELPTKMPIFPLSGALLLPGGRLPLNIFEPRYLAMVRDCIASPQRLIGMIQSKGDEEEASLYRIGCAGRIASFAEQEDGRITITLAGTARFRLLDCDELADGYLMAEVGWQDFEQDLKPDEEIIDRTALVQILRHYFEVKGFSADWKQLESCGDERLVTSLAMICPFEVAEKQALLEAHGLGARAQLLTTILQMATHEESDEQPAKH